MKIVPPAVAMRAIPTKMFAVTLAVAPNPAAVCRLSRCTAYPTQNHRSSCGRKRHQSRAVARTSAVTSAHVRIARSYAVRLRGNGAPATASARLGEAAGE